MKLGTHSYMVRPYYIATEAFEVGGNVIVGKYTSISDGVFFHWKLNHPNIEFTQLVTNFPFHERFEVNNYPPCGGKGNIIIGNDVWIGREAKIMDNVTIGDGAIVSAYSVVTKDIPPYAIVAGNPAIIKKFRFKLDIIEKLLKIKWWNWKEKLIRKRVEDFKDINKFVKKYTK